MEQPKISRHYVYTKHFPLYQDDTTQHDCNQRYILLFGVGKERDDKKHAVKKMAKGILNSSTFLDIRLILMTVFLIALQRSANFTQKNSAWI